MRMHLARVLLFSSMEFFSPKRGLLAHSISAPSPVGVSTHRQTVSGEKDGLRGPVSAPGLLPQGHTWGGGLKVTEMYSFWGGWKSKIKELAGTCSGEQSFLPLLSFWWPR